jgi:PAS domain S-box-containing protein
MYKFKILPDFAKFVRDNHLVAYIEETLRLSRKMNLPLLRYLSQWSDEELVEHSKITTAEYFTYLAENNAKQQIENSIVRWLRDQLEVVGKFEIVAEDLTLIVNIRSKAFKKFIPEFTTDVHKAMQLAGEIDTFNLGEITSSTNAYINILKEKIQQEVYFNAKLVNTSPGMVYVFDLSEQKVIYANKKAEEIFDLSLTDMQQKKNGFLLALTHPDDAESVYEHFLDLDHLKDEQVSSFEHRLKDANGEYRWLRNYETIFKRDAEGKPLQIIGAAYDISEEKKISENLKYREEQLVEAQALAQVGSFEWDIKKDTTVNSKQFYKIVE